MRCDYSCKSTFLKFCLTTSLSLLQIVVIMGILVGLNVIDCNLCVKEEDLDSQQGVIDFSLYLRSSSRSTESDEEINQSLEANGQGNMIAVLDQKNYIEELNRHLKYDLAFKSSVVNLATHS